MRLYTAVLFKNELFVELNWDKGTYVIVYVDGSRSVSEFWMSDIDDLISEEFLEWAPDR